MLRYVSLIILHDWILVIVLHCWILYFWSTVCYFLLFWHVVFLQSFSFQYQCMWRNIKKQKPKFKAIYLITVAGTRGRPICPRSRCSSRLDKAHRRKVELPWFCQIIAWGIHPQPCKSSLTVSMGIYQSNSWCSFHTNSIRRTKYKAKIVCYATFWVPLPIFNRFVAESNHTNATMCLYIAWFQVGLRAKNSWLYRLFMKFRHVVLSSVK